MIAQQTKEVKQEKYTGFIRTLVSAPFKVFGIIK